MTKKGCCKIPQCRNGSEKSCNPEVIYQKFPTKEKIRRRWLRAIQGTFKFFSIDETSTPRICSDHFAEREFIPGKNGKRILKLDAVPTLFTCNIKKEGSIKKEKNPLPPPPPVQPEVGRSRRQASKEALKQMQIILDDDDDDPVEIPDEDDMPLTAIVAPPKKKYKLTHRKSSDGNDREVLVLKTIQPPPEPTPSEEPPIVISGIINHDIENNLELECWVEELEQCQKDLHNKLAEEEKTLATKLEELVEGCKGEVIYKGELTSIIEVGEEVQKAIKMVQESWNKPPIVINQPVAPPPNNYQMPIDSRIGVILSPSSSSANTPPPKLPKIHVATNLQATPVSQPASILRPRTFRGAKKTSPPPATITTRSLAPHPQPTTRSLAPHLQPTTRTVAPATSITTRSVAPHSQPTTRPIAPSTSITTRSVIKRVALPPTPATPPATRSRPTSSVARPTETTVEGGLTAGAASKAIVDLTTSDDGKSAPDSREISFNKLQGKTYPSLVVVARPHLRVTDVNVDRSKLDAKVKSVLMYPATKFTEWLLQQGLVRSDQTCTVHTSSPLKLGMYSDVTKFPYSGGYVWISECCPQRFVSVFCGSIFEGAAHPPLVILKILYHWACQTNIQNVTQWVKVDNLYVKSMYTWLRAICSVSLQTHMRQLGGPHIKVEVGVISLGTTSQDGSARQVKVEVLGVLETSTKLIKLRAIEPLTDGDRNYKKRFCKILEPLAQWVHPSSTIVTDLTVDKATLQSMGFNQVIQNTGESNKTIMEYLRRIVPRMFQNTLSLLSRQIIQQFLDELVWREWFGTTSMLAFDNLVAHVAEQTRFDGTASLVMRLNRVAMNPFKNWSVPVSSSTVVPPPPKPFQDQSKKRKRTSQVEPITQERPPKSISPDVPEQMVPLENYYYGTIDQYPTKINVKLSNLKCPFCKETFNNNILLMSHLFRHAHNVKDGEMCRYCLTSVQTENDLRKHVASTHPVETKHENGFMCLICETQYMNPFVLGKHMSKEHCPSELPYQCGTCGYRCSNHKQAIDHFYKQHDNGPTIQCPFCLKSTTVFSTSRNIAQNMHFFIQHLQKHQRKLYARKCPKCALWFIQKDLLREHQTKMHVSQRGKTGLISWSAPPRSGAVMVPKSKMDIYPCDADAINFSNLYYNVAKNLKCKECEGSMDSNKHFPSFETCQNCQYSTCCSKTMQVHTSKCVKNAQKNAPNDPLPCKMFCICGFNHQDGNQMAKHLALCEKKSAYPSLSEAKSASVTHSMLDVLGLVRKPGEFSCAKKSTTPKKKVVETITIIEEDGATSTKVEKAKRKSSQNKEEINAKKVKINDEKSEVAFVDEHTSEEEVKTKKAKIDVEVKETEVAFVEEHKEEEHKSKEEETDMLAMDDDATKNAEEILIIINEDDDNLETEKDDTRIVNLDETENSTKIVNEEKKEINKDAVISLEKEKEEPEKTSKKDSINLNEEENNSPREKEAENNIVDENAKVDDKNEDSAEKVSETPEKPEENEVKVSSLQSSNSELEKKVSEDNTEAIVAINSEPVKENSPMEMAEVESVKEASMDVDSRSNEPMEFDDVSNSAMETD
ncbi:unnamed protein product [Ceutorhynchus assimilis]|uniref:Pogo transposable element derived with ZNF domain n=1 Tax=Ceutorhynchus assimilis TaxID=467358 RepID=A0A9N9N039_9CUCU|nr:unnamed protein product [Ceutorhynchus assimilis]